jgi:hypothetical protein
MRCERRDKRSLDEMRSVLGFSGEQFGDLAIVRRRVILRLPAPS